MRTKRLSTLRFLTLVLGLCCAVWTNAQSIVEGRFVLITTEAEFTDGDYLILSGKEGSVQALNNVFNKGSSQGSRITLVEEAVTQPPSTMVWQIRKTEKGFSVKNVAEQQYLTQNEAHTTRSLGLTRSASYFRLLAFQEGKADWQTNQRFKNAFRWSPADGTFANFESGDLYQNVYLFKREGGEPIPEPPTTDPNTLLVSIGATGYATFFSEHAVQIPHSLQAFVGTLETPNTLLLSPLHNFIPARTAVVLYTTTPQTFVLTLAEGVEPITQTNELQGTTTEIPYEALLNTPQQTYYALADLNGKVGFYRVYRSIPAGKAYLLLSSERSTQGINFSFDNCVTNILPSPAPTISTPYYDLNGRRLRQRHSGQLYLQNGKKNLHP